ncbi:MAG: TIM barrel protein [Firmicutes bacterium]|nr:TIM barrel protein [Bacillota bacterium]
MTKDLKIRFGPSGNDELFYAQGNKSTIQAPAWLSRMGLSAMEINFTRGTKMSVETARKIGDEARKYDIELSAHAPYYINLANDEAFEKNYNWIKQCLVLLKEMGFRRLVVHLATQGERSREDALKSVGINLIKIIEKLDSDGLSDFLLCIETMGKYSAIGNVEEICAFCKVDPRVIPTLDFGHINCLLQGELQTNPNKIGEVIEYVEREIGREKLKIVHVHWSAIVYSEKGERYHTKLSDNKWSFSFEPFARIIKEKELTPVIICESDSIMAQDAQKLKREYEKILGKEIN